MDYKEPRAEYENSKISFKKLSKKYNIHYKKLERVAKKYGWVKYNPMVPVIRVESIEQPKAQRVETQEEKELYQYLIKLIKTPLDRVLVESYFNSYKLFKALESDLDYGDINQNETLRLQQLQIERNNLIKLGKDIRELSWRNGTH